MPFIPTLPPPLASPLSLLFYLASLSPVLVVADIVGYLLWFLADLINEGGFVGHHETTYFPSFVGSIRTLHQLLFDGLVACGGSFLIEMLWGDITCGWAEGERSIGDGLANVPAEDSGTCYSSRVWWCAGVSVWIRTLKFITRRREGVDWERTRKCMHRAVSSSRIIGNDRSSLFSPSAGIDGDFLPPYFTSEFMLMTMMNRILSLGRIANQLNDNACASQAILNILLNCSNIDIGTELSEFKEYTREMSPKTLQMKGLAISDSSLLHEGNEETYHFISYVPAYGKLWELDGLKSGPLEVGDVTATTEWIDVVQPALRMKMRKYGSGGDGGGHDIRFSLLPIVDDAYEKANNKWEYWKSER
ncbi:cysteine proteinase [Armillaria gallica]|uniref:ubiquitinyl hydrolase 1 n=1 Tax=Armillaria gallica TaxID=47427 RepID=A0A2H3CEZ7_ARMGA|nr:cysteine proteinase [Armillaria gallica]